MFHFTIRELILLTLVVAMGDSNTVWADPPTTLHDPPKTKSKTVETTCGGVRFTLDLPVTWGEWYDDDQRDEASAHKSQSDIRRFIGTFHETSIFLNRHEVCDIDSAATAARKRLADLPDEKMLNARKEKRMAGHRP